MNLRESIDQALKMREELKAKGLSPADLAFSFEAVVREVWPFTREWKYLCNACGDYGLEMHECPGDATCGRHKPHLAHEYGSPCWCSAGARFREKQKPTPEDFTAAGKAPRKQPTRFGH